jgi:hypothetical protein
VHRSRLIQMLGRPVVCFLTLSMLCVSLLVVEMAISYVF